MVPLIRSIVVTIPVSACWANATELMSASIEPAKIILPSLIENLSVFGRSQTIWNERIGSLVGRKSVESMPSSPSGNPYQDTAPAALDHAPARSAGVRA